MTQAIQTQDAGQKSIRQFLEMPSTIQKMNAVVPKHLTGDRLARLCALAVHRSPKLMNCDPVTLLGAMMAVGSLGLEPNTPLGHSYLIPFGKSVTLVIGFKGFIELAKRANPEIVIHGDVAYEQDEFSYEYGSNAGLRHRPAHVEGDKPLYAYAYARLGSAFEFVVLPWSKIIKTRNGSSGYQNAKKYGDKTPWDEHLHEMAAKTAIRYLGKGLCLSPEFHVAAQIDGRAEGGRIDFAKLASAEVIEPGSLDIDAATVEPPPVETKADPLASLKDKAKAGAKGSADPTPTADDLNFQ